MSEELAKAVERVRMDANHCGTWVLLKSMADIYENFEIIDGEWLAIINERFAKQEAKKG